MLRYVIYMMIGCCIGLIIKGLSKAAKKGDRKNDKIRSDYRCKNASNCGCGDVCCWTCFVADACMKDGKCINNPGICRKSIIIR